MTDATTRNRCTTVSRIDGLRCVWESYPAHDGLCCYHAAPHFLREDCGGRVVESTQPA